jgi:hypothetical protein
MERIEGYIVNVYAFTLASVAFCKFSASKTLLEALENLYLPKFVTGFAFLE